VSLIKNYLHLNGKSEKYIYRLDSFLESPISSFGFTVDRIENRIFDNEIIVGDIDTNFEVILFMNPQCKRCKLILKNLSRLFLEFDDSVHLRILYSGKTDSDFEAKIMFFELLTSLAFLSQK